MANIVDPDQTVQEQSDLGPQGLHAIWYTCKYVVKTKIAAGDTCILNPVLAGSENVNLWCLILNSCMWNRRSNPIL